VSVLRAGASVLAETVAGGDSTAPPEEEANGEADEVHPLSMTMHEAVVRRAVRVSRVFEVTVSAPVLDPRGGSLGLPQQVAPDATAPLVCPGLNISGSGSNQPRAGKPPGRRLVRGAEGVGTRLSDESAPFLEPAESVRMRGYRQHHRAG